MYSLYIKERAKDKFNGKLQVYQMVYRHIAGTQRFVFGPKTSANDTKVILIYVYIHIHKFVYVSPNCYQYESLYIYINV